MAMKLQDALMKVYSSVGNQEYAERKTNLFIHRLHGDFSTENIKQMAIAMLDVDCEKELLSLI